MKRRRAEGWTQTAIWTTPRIREQVAARATHLGVHKHMILTAALLSGLRTVTSSEIIHVQRQWREKVKPLSECYFKTNDPRRIRRTPCNTLAAS